MATFTWFATNVLPILLAALANYVVKQKAADQARADDISLGSATTAAATNKETSDAMRRAADAAVNSTRGLDLDDALGSGARQF